MSLDADILIDRRRLKRRLTLWRVLAIFSVVGVVALLAARSENMAGSSFTRGAHIARVSINGFIGDPRERHEMFEKIRKDKNVKAVIISVDSPGGTTSGGEALYNDLRMLAEAKPVASVFGTAATSAAYMGGIATDYIVARGNTITGSVGVIFQWAEVSEALSKLGVKIEEIRSGRLKANPSLFKPTDEEARRISEELVRESMNWFVGLVAERRKNASAALDDIRTGRIYTGRQALSIGLIDAIGDEKTALKWFTDVRQVKAGLKVHDWKPERNRNNGIFESAITTIATKLGVIGPIEATVLNQIGGVVDRPLDGLFSIWHAK